MTFPQRRSGRFSGAGHATFLVTNIQIWTGLL
jgi:hypothetical protein